MTTSTVKTVCPYCGVGCGMVLHARDGKVVKVEGDVDHPANRGRLCTKGKSAHQMLDAPGRLQHAYVREKRGHDPVAKPLDEAVAEAGQRLRDILQEHGPDAVAFYVSGQLSLEAQYLVNKLAKGYVRTSQIEANSRLCMASASSGYRQSLGADAPPGSYDDFDQADAFLVIGANMADCHPVLFLRMMERVKSGAKLIVVDPRRTATAEKADLFLQIRPGSDLALLNGLLRLVHQAGHTDQEFIAAHTEGWEAMPALLAEYPPERVESLTGIPEADLRKAAQWIGEAGTFTSCWTMGLNQSTQGVWHTNALCNLHLALGQICRPGGGPFSLTGQPNAMGGREMGYMGPGLPGQRTLLDPDDRAFVEDAWCLPRGALPGDSGAGTIDLFARMAEGRIKACWILCTNPVASVANRKNVIAGLEAAELVIVQDAFLDTETTRYADILLPAALWAEGDGVMVNSERVLTRMRPAVEPPGQALADWKLVARMAQAMGYGDAFNYATAGDVFAEITRFANPATGYDLRGIGYDSLEESPRQWPCGPGSTSTRHPVRYLAGDGRTPHFPTPSGKARFHARHAGAPAERVCAEYPWVLNTGRVPHQWHTMTRTGRIPMLNRLNPGPFIEIHPDDAADQGIVAGEPVAVSSARGQAVVPACISDRVLPGTCFVPMHWNDNFGEALCINEVTSDAVDPVSLQPEYKYAAVSLQRVTQAADIAAGASIATAPSVDAPEAGVGSTQVLDALAAMLQLDKSPVPEADASERLYLAGYVSGLRLDPGHGRSGVPVVPADAPLGPAIRLWLDGLLAGVYSRRQPLAGELALRGDGACEPSADPAREKGARVVRSRPRVVLLWASQTGNVESLTERYATQLMNAGFDIRLACMADYALEDLGRADFVLLMTSTFGDGDPPDNGVAFWHALREQPAPSLSSLHYAVLALGDRLYDAFCGHGRQLDERLAALGAKRLTGRVDCDAGFQPDADNWLDAVIVRIKEVARERETMDSGAPSVPPGKGNPVATKLVGNIRLNREGSAKDTRLLVFDTGGAGLEYDVGDALGVWPSNCPDLVDSMIESAGLKADAPVALGGAPECSLKDALTHKLDITRPHPETLRCIGALGGHDQLLSMLEESSRALLRQWLSGKQLADVLEAFPAELDPQAFVDLFKPLQPRLYSIASSPLEHPGAVHLAVSVVRYTNGRGLRKGVASTFLAERAQEVSVPVFVQKTAHFRPPADGEVPMIMVGPGTGVAPFRGFLQDRRARGARGANWLFFGEQHAASDAYFADEFAEMQASGLLTRFDQTYSRDQPHKVYVQDRLREHGAEIWSWLQAGANFYVCGDALRMARDVDAALRDVVAEHGGMSDTEAAAYVSRLGRERRYVRDVY